MSDLIGLSYEKRIQFGGRIVIIGAGSVSQCLQSILLKRMDMEFNKVTIVEMKNREACPSVLIANGATYIQERITRHNLHEVLSNLVAAGDLIIDLAWGISTIDIISWCQSHSVIYINSSIEVWDDSSRRLEDDTIYSRYLEFFDFVKKRGGGKTTALIEHGCNPGLVNHWTKQGMEHLAQQILTRFPISVERRLSLEKSIEESDYAMMAYLTGTKVIHISERDSQTASIPAERRGEFVNTWSPDGFHHESNAPAELAWGTHERTLPHNAVVHSNGPGNKIYLTGKSMNVLAYSWVPSGEIVGQLSAHGEVFTISKNLTVRQDEQVVYRPSVYFVYKPCDQALECLSEQNRPNQFQTSRKRVLTEDIISGADEVGVLLLGHDLNGWWIGSCLDIYETRRHVQGQNATTLQVASSLFAAMLYSIRNSNAGICTPDDIPYQEILPVAAPYLGTLRSMPTNWRPPKTTGIAEPASRLTWQLEDFLLDNDSDPKRKAV